MLKSKEALELAKELTPYTFGAPVLILVGLAPKSALLCWVTLGLAALYMGLLVLLITKLHKRRPSVH